MGKGSEAKREKGGVRPQAEVVGEGEGRRSSRSGLLREANIIFFNSVIFIQHRYYKCY